jgi:glucose/arabinose dehydrogenase
MRTSRSVSVVAMALLMAAAVGARQAPPPQRSRTATAGEQTGGQNNRTSRLGKGPWEFQTADYRIRVSTVVDGLDRPHGMAFLPDGSMLITERPGRLRIVRNGVLDPQPISGVPAVLLKDFDGLLDVALHPRFAENRFVYLSYSKPHPGDGGGQTALARGRYDGGQALADVQDIFIGRGTSPRAQLQSVMARMVFGKDGTLYMTSATPNMDRFQAQDPTSHRGKVLRMRDDGTAPPDNPLIGKTGHGLPYHAEIYTVGHRDGMAITVHPVTGEIWEVENGPQGGDELNILKPGRNYGWPLISLGREYSGAPIDRDMESMEGAFMFWAPSIAPSSVMFYTGDRFPDWKGNLLVSALRGSRIERVAFNSRGLPLDITSNNTEFLLYELKQRIRQVAQGPDGLLYVLTDYTNGALLRIEPVGAGKAAAASARR